MAQHKAPTAVTIASTEDNSALRGWIDRYWKFGAAIVVIVSGWLIYQTRAKAARKELSEAGWSRLLQTATEDPRTGTLSGTPEDLRRLESEIKDSPAAAWSLYIAATSAVDKHDFDAAEAALAELRRNHPTHPLVAQTFSANGTTAAESVVDELTRRIAAQKSFTASHSGLFENPALPADAPRVRLNTDKGPIVIGLYTDRAPKYVENFLKLVRDGSYVGTKFHSIHKGEYVQGGDPNSIAGAPETWGKGGPGYTLEREPDQLRNFAGVISAVPAPGEAKMVSGSQFAITTADAHRLDDTHIVFGRVVEGMELVREIEQSPIADNAFDQPRDPVTVQSAEVL